MLLDGQMDGMTAANRFEYSPTILIYAILQHDTIYHVYN